MRKLVIPMLVLLAAGCDATRRDFTYCDHAHGCKDNTYICDFAQGLCVPADAGAGGAKDAADAPSSPEVGGADLSVVDAGADLAKDLASEGLDASPSVDLVAVDGPADAPALDLPGLDTRVADAPSDGPGTCGTDDNCSGVAGKPYCMKPFCVACASKPDAGGFVCPSATPVCNAASGGCVECVQNSDCTQAAKGFCVQNKCVGCDDPGARASGGGDAGVGDAGAARDGGTAASAACTGATPVCVASSSGGSKAGQCVGCQSSSDCSGSTPICDATTSYTCGACTSDSDCVAKGVGPGICMFKQTGTFPQDGRCLTDGDGIIYVQNLNATGSCNSATGSLAAPFCQPQNAIDAVTGSRRIVVIMGATALTGWSASLGNNSQPVFVIGRNNPTILVGAAASGIHIVSGRVYVRGLTVQGAGTNAVGPGIQVESGAVLGLDRCIVMGNKGGLLVNDGAGFDIANSIFAQNDGGGVPGSVAVFGGVYLGFSSDATLPHRFWFNTVADNTQIGLACTSSKQTIDDCLLAGDQGGEAANCTLSATTDSPTSAPSGVQAPGFTSDSRSPNFSSTNPFHLTATSPCALATPAKVPASADHPPDDVDGDSRPSIPGGLISCGADQ